MGLVDYSSDSSESDEVAGPQAKKQKTSDNEATTATSSTAKNELPPLPSAFHDLYASTVRVSASDDPALHQGRKRVNPHKVGNWPSHLYIEWHPTPTEQTTLTTLLSTLQSNLTSPSSYLPNPITITSFLTSDLGAPQPLHISLSRPIVLSTAQKDSFLSALESRIRASGIAPFELAPQGLEWHRTAESARSFLVLRVGSTETRSIATTDDAAHTAKSQAGEEANSSDSDNKPAATNPQLTALLCRTNALVTAFGQPALYAFADRKTSTPNTPLVPTSARAGRGSGTEEGPNTDVDKAFHISIAWSPAEPSAEVRRLTSEAFHTAYEHEHIPHGESSRSSGGEKQPPDKKSPTTLEDAVAAMRVRVDGVKAKIGNVVTHIPLPDPRGKGTGIGGTRGGGLFGI
ncbi:U6 snRNA phosphodiesterase Usb1 [Nemania abortiva]|nr:U6 snRNA phosphodiesterase Usb1 [Nemania abortiva]